MPTFESDFGLVVGINHYPGFEDLSGAVADAEDFDNWLIDANTGGGVPPENRRCILSSEYSGKPVQEDIDLALEQLFSRIGHNQVRRFYLYFSGHGLASSRMGADLCLAVWSSVRRNAALNSEAYYELLAGTGRFKEIVCFLDCCRVRVINSRGMISTLGRPMPNELTGTERRLIAYSTEYQNAAYEAANGVGSTNVRGYFTKALMEALRGGAAQTSGGVPARRLKQYVENRTRKLAEADGQYQLPEVDLNFVRENEPIFGSAIPSRVLEITFSSHRVNRNINVIGPDDDIVDTIIATNTPFHLHLGIGLHLLVDPIDHYIISVREGDKHARF